MATDRNFREVTARTSSYLKKLRADMPETMRGFSALAQAVGKPGVLDAKTKELIAMALSVAARCDPCLGYHAEALGSSLDPPMKPQINPFESEHPMTGPSPAIAAACLATLLCASAAAQPAAAALPAATPATGVDLSQMPVPDPQKLPPGAYRDLVLYGQSLTNRTFAHIGPEVADRKMRFAGNNLACASCHQAGATKPFAIPWSGVSASFPQYRAREDTISTVEDRVNGCMERSMNGRALPLDSPEMRAYVTYIAFLSQGIPIGGKVEGAATFPYKMPNRRADPAAGKPVYEAKCSVCHGADGQGQRAGKAGDTQGYSFPPLWGPDSFNNGAGMNRLIMATRFVKANMPLGASHGAAQLTDDEAYDVSAYVLSQPRPVKQGLERDFPARWNKPVDAAFPPYLIGTADEHRYGPYPPMVEKQKSLEAQLKADAARQLPTGKAAAPK